ncbi:hypothetical protein WG904_18700 [Pedobacter sp. Du54]|uniref:DUF7103 family protein n=1 Tax=Pedobacter anseongensis TaxID=3133439 RepID=UPI0030966792
MSNTNYKLISYCAVRRVIGFLGILLPIVLFFNSSYCSLPLEKSISAYYYSNLGDVFVAILIALAMFLFSYRGYEEQLDNWITNIAALAAIGVAFFPCNGVEKLCVICNHIRLSKETYTTIHYISASIFFISLSILLLVYFTKSDKKDKADKTEEKRLRNMIYRGCGAIMVICLLIIAAFKFFNLGNERIFWPESVALFAFGFAWLVKGELLLGDK